MFYHKVIGVSLFFLFVEGKAASPDVTRVLQSIPVSSNALQILLVGANLHCGKFVKHEFDAVFRE